MKPLFVAVAAALGLVTGSLASVAGVPSVLPAACPLAEGAQPAVAIQLPAAREIWTILPAMGMAPELEQDSRPATAVVYPSDIHLAPTQPNAPNEWSNAVCVVTADGVSTMYVNISRSGFVAP